MTALEYLACIGSCLLTWLSLTVEAIGYVGRAVSANDNPGPWNIGPYILQAVLLLVAPALFAASIYMELGRIVHMLDGDHALFIRRTWLTKIFVGDDILSFTIQSSGAGLLASSTTQTINTGKAIVVCGLVSSAKTDKANASLHARANDGGNSSSNSSSSASSSSPPRCSTSASTSSLHKSAPTCRGGETTCSRSTSLAYSSSSGAC